MGIVLLIKMLNDPANANLECGKQFTHASWLMSHMLSHSSTKSFKCETCNKAFKYSGYLTSHQKVCSASAAASSSAFVTASAASALDLRVGAIFWGRCSGYPWWPCMIIGRRLTTEKIKSHNPKLWPPKISERKDFPSFMILAVNDDEGNFSLLEVDEKIKSVGDLLLNFESK